MLQRLLRVGSLCLASSLSILAAACGANVVVDHPGGSGGNGGAGGHGGSTSTVSFTTSITGQVSVVSSTGSDTSTAVVGVGPSTGVGPPPGCGCQEFCAVLQGCGFPAFNCMSLCGQASPQVLDCVCQNKATCNLKMCLGMGSGGTAGVGPGAAVSSSSGGPGQTCSTCTTAAVQGPCALDANACTADPGCMGILQCHQMCGWTPQCKQSCEGANQAGLAAFDQLVGCAVCESCIMECQGTGLVGEYCVMPP